jgi:hypothetical protein
LRSLVPVDHFELIYNGRVVASHALDGARTSADISGSIDVADSGWLVLRAWNEQANPLVLDIYPYASTSPVYVTVPGKTPRSPADATYFAHWLDRVIEAADKRNDYNNANEKQLTLDYLESARRIYQAAQ